MTSANIKQTQNKKIIMIVDDTESYRLLIKSYFENDFEIITMCDGHEAIVYLSKNKPPDLILLDMEMPNMNGRVFLRRLKYGNAILNKIPVIFLTTVNSKLIINSAYKKGVIDYIIKPFKQEVLEDKVRQLLETGN